MKNENILYLAELDLQLEDIELIRPTESYVDKGHAILQRIQSSNSNFNWRSFWISAFPICAAILGVIGFAVESVGTDRGLPAKVSESENMSTPSSRIIVQQLAALHTSEIVAPASRPSTPNATPEATPDPTQHNTVDRLFIANCQECHELTIMEKLRPEDFEGTPDRMNELMMQTIRELAGTLGS
jgi:hypothetical protein